MSQGYRVQTVARVLGWKLLSIYFEDESKWSNPGLMVSPASITLCIALSGGMLSSDEEHNFYGSLGARGPEDVKQAFAELLAAFTDNRETTIKGGNAAYFQKQFPVSPQLQNHLELFGAVSDNSYGDLRNAVDEINSWVSHQTRGMIPHLVNSDLLARANIVLLNALSFKGFWRSTFDQSLTEKRFPFRLSKSRTVRLPMMIQRQTEVLTARGPGYTAARLPYRGTSRLMPFLSFSAYLPDEGKSVSQLLEKLDRGHGQFRPTNYSRFGLPKFEIESSLTILPVLKDLGYPIPKEIDDVIHKTKITVDEEGTRAAAATAAVSRGCGVPAPLPDLIFNRPFAFCIGDEASGIALFSGVFSPSQ
jgi:serine protease inhibitor